MKINPNVDLDIHAFSGGGITDYDSGMTNVVVHKSGDRYRATQRPGIDISEDASVITGLNDRGRGIYYWETNTTLYIVHDNDVYSGTQDSAAVGTITAGTERVTMLETIGVPRLVILDAENNEGWYMSDAEVVTEIDKTGATGFFPSTLVHGGAILDSYLFVMDEDGIIYNSNLDDPTVFGALSFLEAERENDKGVYLGKHHDHIVAFGTRTIEFFYDGQNATGSPLNRRTDISYNIGCADGLGVWEDGDITFFIGSNPSGELGIYKLTNFQTKLVSNDSMNSYITNTLTQESIHIALEGLSAMGNRTLLLTFYTLTGSPTQILPRITISFDTVTGLWGFWETNLNSHTTFPLMSWTKRTGGQNATLEARTGEGILYNGDIISIHDSLNPVDTLLATSVFVAGVFEDGVFSESSGSGTNVPITIRTGLMDGGTTAYKFQSKETIVMENTDNVQTLTIKHSDEATNNFNTGTGINTTLDRKEVHQGGRFMKRNYQLEYSGDEQIFIEALDVELQAGL